MLFTPLLPEAASGTLEPRHTVVPLRAMCPHAELLLGSAPRVDLEARTATVETDAGEQIVRLGELVLALGAVPRGPVPGPSTALVVQVAGRGDPSPQPRPARARSRGRRARRRSAAGTADVRLRRRGLRRRRGARGALRPRRRRDPLLPGAARRPRGAGCSSTPRRRSCRRSRRGSATTRRASWRARGVEIHVGTRSTLSSADEVVLADGTQIPTRTLVWTAGVAAAPAPPRARGAARRTRPRRVDEFLRVRPRARLGARRLARVPNTRRPTVPIRRPASTHFARRAGSRRICAGDPQPYGYRMLGQVATLGRYKGIADVLGMRLRGFPGWFVTRSYHLYQLPLALAEAARRRRLDGVAALPARRRRARDAPPGGGAARALQRAVETLPRRRDAFEQVAVLARRGRARRPS